MIIILLVLLVLFIYSLLPIEGFNVTSYNNSRVPLNKQDTLYETEIKTLNEIFEQTNLQGFPEVYSFQKLPNYLKFPMQSSFSEIVLQRLNDIFSKSKDYKQSEFVIIKDMYDIKWKDIETSRHFVFNIDVRNKTFNWAKRLRIYVIVNDIKSFLTDTGEYFEPVDKNLLPNIIVNTISLEESTERLLIGGIDAEIGNESYYNYYKIKNVLYLMDPFLTSGKDMAITETMKLDFKQVLEIKKRIEEEKMKSKGGFCYNTSNLLAKTKEECIDSGGIWDYVPENSYECPYYRSNENYPNDFGGLSGDKCQLPKNMQIIGNRNFSNDPSYRPLCYNCKDNLFGEGSLGFCCDDQNDKEKYPGLITPDYAFIGDNVLREKYADGLAQKTLNVK
jgi:hypothetical protein